MCWIRTRLQPAINRKLQWPAVWPRCASVCMFSVSKVRRRSHSTHLIDLILRRQILFGCSTSSYVARSPLSGCLEMRLALPLIMHSCKINEQHWNRSGVYSLQLIDYGLPHARQFVLSTVVVVLYSLFSSRPTIIWWLIRSCYSAKTLLMLAENWIVTDKTF